MKFNNKRVFYEMSFIHLFLFESWLVGLPEWRYWTLTILSYCQCSMFLFWQFYVPVGAIQKKKQIIIPPHQLLRYCKYKILESSIISQTPFINWNLSHSMKKINGHDFQILALLLMIILFDKYSELWFWVLDKDHKILAKYISTTSLKYTMICQKEKENY